MSKTDREALNTGLETFEKVLGTMENPINLTGDDEKTKWFDACDVLSYVHKSDEKCCVWAYLPDYDYFSNFKW